MRNKIISVFVLVICMICCTTVYAAEGTITDFYVDSTGKAEIIGYFDDTDRECTTMMMYDASNPYEWESDATSHIMYVNQLPMGNNGTFYYHFQIKEKFSKSSYVLKINGGELISDAGTLREIPSKIHNVSDNAMRIGNDIYDIGCPAYTPDNIAASLARGGNRIYYKISGAWFDMLDPAATGTSYFTIDNAIDPAEWDAWVIDNYYQY